MTMRVNAEGQIESVKTVPVEHTSVIDSRQELVDALGRAQANVQEITQDLADYDALVAQQQPAPAAPEAPTAPTTDASPDSAPAEPTQVDPSNGAAQ